MYYIIYCTVNNINKKMYIGKHATKDINDGYLGSGLALAKAIKKYGKESFSKNILFICASEEEMNQKEAELINDEVVASNNYYNIALGGKGGNIVLKEQHPLYEVVKQKISRSQRMRSEEMSNIVKELHKQRRVGMYGKTQSDYQKKRVSEVQKNRKHTDEHTSKQRASILKTFNAPGYVHPNTGKKRSNEEIEAMRLRTLSRPKKSCEYCGKDVDERNFARYHGDKCKHKPL